MATSDSLPAPSPTSVLEMMRTLPAAQREILRLRVVAGLSAEQVATLLGCSPEAVRLRQHRALEALRRALASGPPP